MPKKNASGKPRRRPVQHEERLQSAVAKLLDHSGLLWCHVPNGGQRNAVTAAKLKGQGVKPGVPDLLVFDAPYEEDAMLEYYGLAIELKNGKAGRVSEHQQRWMDDLKARGWRVEVCRSLDEVIALLRKCYPHKYQ